MHLKLRYFDTRYIETLYIALIQLNNIIFSYFSINSW